MHFNHYKHLSTDWGTDWTIYTTGSTCRSVKLVVLLLLLFLLLILLLLSLFFSFVTYLLLLLLLCCPFKRIIWTTKNFKSSCFSSFFHPSRQHVLMNKKHAAARKASEALKGYIGQMADALHNYRWMLDANSK